MLRALRPSHLRTQTLAAAAAAEATAKHCSQVSCPGPNAHRRDAQKRNLTTSQKARRGARHIEAPPRPPPPPTPTQMHTKRKVGDLRRRLYPTFSVFSLLIRLWLSSSSSSFFTSTEFPMSPESGALLLTSPAAVTPPLPAPPQWKGLAPPPLPLAPKP